MNKLAKSITLAVSLLVMTNAQAGVSEVTWSNPDKYRDVDVGEGHRAKFKARVFAEFEQHFAKLASQLPEGQTLKIVVKDVDLAGDVNHGGMHRIRVVKELFYPRLKFSYQLLDGNQQLLSSDEINLTDMNFMLGARLKYHNDQLSYEKRMLDDWFADTFNQ